MPFIKQADRQARRPPAEVGNIFTGRTNEQHFFVEHVLTPEVPAYHMISVWGPAGVGKSTLLARLRDEACRPGFKDTCLTALVDERLFTPADLMDRCAAQLRLAGAPLAAFEQALARYKQAIQQREPEREAARAAFLREVAAQAGSKVMGEPLLGGLYEAVASEASASFWSGRRSSRPAGEAGHLNNPLGDLTRVFVEDLNWLTTTEAPLSPDQMKRGCRVILFFDMSEPSAAETINWLLHHALPATISDQVVLVVAGREPIERSLPNEQPVYAMPLAPFTEDETRTYLAECGMTAADRVAAIWHLSGGLPLYVSMLAYDQAGHVDETTDVVANIVRWMAEQDHSTQRLVLQAALFSRPFNQDDLAAFHALSEQERTDLYRWLIGLPFVQPRSLDGRHRYHGLTQQLLSRAFAQHAPQEEQAIADFDQAAALDPQLGGVSLLRSLAYWGLNMYRRGREDFDQAIELDPNDVEAYVLRGMAYCCLGEESQAIADFDRTLELDPSDALAYAGRGHVYLEMGEIERARADLLRSQAFAPHDVYVGLLLEWLSLCQQESIPDRPGLPERLETLAALDRQQPAALLCQGIALILRERFEEALAALDQALLLNPGMAEVSFWKSLTSALLGRDEEARASLEQVLTAELPLPAVLLASLRWLEQKRPDFYRQYAEPVLARAEGGQEQCA